MRQSQANVDRVSDESSQLQHYHLQQPSYIQRHYGILVDHLDVKVLLPHLIQKGLLTRCEIEQLTLRRDQKGAYEQTTYFLDNILQTKGECGLEIFLECLKEEKEHMGHTFLAAYLGLSSHLPIDV